MSTTITNLPETSKVNDSDYLVLDQPDKTVKSTVSNFLTDTPVERYRWSRNGVSERLTSG